MGAVVLAIVVGANGVIADGPAVAAIPGLVVPAAAYICEGILGNGMTDQSRVHNDPSSLALDKICSQYFSVTCLSFRSLHMEKAFSMNRCKVSGHPCFCCCCCGYVIAPEDPAVAPAVIVVEGAVVAVVCAGTAVAAAA